MKLSKETMEILSNFSSITPNILIRKGKKIGTASSSNDIIAYYEGADDFEKDVCIFDLNELLAVISSFDDPTVTLDDKFLTVSEGNQTVKFNYAEVTSIKTSPEKGVKFPVADLSFKLTNDVISKIHKMSAILKAKDLSVVGDGEKVVIKIYNSANPSSNNFEHDLKVSTTDVFSLDFTVERFKLFPGDYTVDVSSRKISRFTNETIGLVYYIALNPDSDTKGLQ